MMLDAAPAFSLLGPLGAWDVAERGLTGQANSPTNKS